MEKDDLITRAETKLHEAIIQAREADAKVFALSTGALAISVTFRTSLVSRAPVALWLLSVTWVAFALCSIAYIFSRLLDALVYIELTREYLEITKSGSSQFSQKLSWKKRIFVDASHAVMYFCFIIGVVSLTAFAIINNVPML